MNEQPESGEPLLDNLMSSTATDSESVYQAAHHNLAVCSSGWPDDQIKIMVSFVEFISSVTFC